MRSFILVALVAGAVSAAHLAHVPHRGRHVEVARDLYDGSELNHIAQAPPTLTRRKRCPARGTGSSLTGGGQFSTSPSEPESKPPPSPPKTSETETQTTASSDDKPPPSRSRPPRPSSSSSSQSQSQSDPPPPPPKPTTKTTQAPPVQRPTSSAPPPPSSTEEPDSGPPPSRTQNGAAPSATRGAGSDLYLQSLSLPLNYSAHGFFRGVHRGELTFYDQGLTACGDTYNDRSLTAAISRKVFDSWPGCTYATNRCGVCGPFVGGRYFLGPGNEVVKGSSHATIGGDYLINCVQGEQCHRPLTVTAHHPVTGARVQVAVVDRCEGCEDDDLDVTPAAFLRLTRPTLDLSRLSEEQLMEEALKDPLGRHQIIWQFDRIQRFGPVRHV